VRKGSASLTLAAKYKPLSQEATERNGVQGINFRNAAFMPLARGLANGR
jgi:hypothetical protein